MVVVVEVVEIEKELIVDVVLILPVKLLDSERELEVEVGFGDVNDAVELLDIVAGTGEIVTVDILVVVPVVGSTMVVVLELELRL